MHIATVHHQSTTLISAMTGSTKNETTAKWSAVIKKVLINALLKYSNGRYSNLSNDKTSWQRVVDEFNNKTNLNYSKGMLTTQCFSLRSGFLEFEKYSTQSGFGMDARGMVTGSPESLNAYYISHPKARVFAEGPLPFYDDLQILFGSKFMHIQFKILATCTNSKFVKSEEDHAKGHFSRPPTSVTSHQPKRPTTEKAAVSAAVTPSGHPWQDQSQSGSPVSSARLIEPV